MITAEIKIHPEPVTTYTSGTYTGLSNTQRLELATKELAISKEKYQVGDKVKSTWVNSGWKIIVGFEDDPSKAVWSQEKPCLIYCVSEDIYKQKPEDAKSKAIKYGLHELDEDSLIRSTETIEVQDVNSEAANA